MCISLHSDMSATKAIFEKYKPTYVVHLAAMVGGLFKNMKYKLDFLVSLGISLFCGFYLIANIVAWQYIFLCMLMQRNNMLMNDTVLHCSYEFKVQSVILCKEMSVFFNVAHHFCLRLKSVCPVCPRASSQTRSHIL